MDMHLDTALLHKLDGATWLYIQTPVKFKQGDIRPWYPEVIRVTYCHVKSAAALAAHTS